MNGYPLNRTFGQPNWFAGAIELTSGGKVVELDAPHSHRAGPDSYDEEDDYSLSEDNGRILPDPPAEDTMQWVGLAVLGGLALWAIMRK